MNNNNYFKSFKFNTYTRILYFIFVMTTNVLIMCTNINSFINENVVNLGTQNTQSEISNEYVIEDPFHITSINQETYFEISKFANPNLSGINIPCHNYDEELDIINEYVIDNYPEINENSFISTSTETEMVNNALKEYRNIQKKDKILENSIFPSICQEIKHFDIRNAFNNDQNVIASTNEKKIYTNNLNVNSQLQINNYQDSKEIHTLKSENFLSLNESICNNKSYSLDFIEKNLPISEQLIQSKNKSSKNMANQKFFSENQILDTIKITSTQKNIIKKRNVYVKTNIKTNHISKSVFKRTHDRTNKTFREKNILIKKRNLTITDRNNKQYEILQRAKNEENYITLKCKKCINLYEKKIRNSNYYQGITVFMNHKYNCCMIQDCQTILTDEITKKHDFFSKSIKYSQFVSIKDLSNLPEVSRKTVESKLLNKEEWILEFDLNPKKIIKIQFKSLFSETEWLSCCKILNDISFKKIHIIRKDNFKYKCLQNFCIIYRHLLTYNTLWVIAKTKTDINIFYFLILQPMRYLAKMINPHKKTIYFNKFEKIYDLLSIYQALKYFKVNYKDELSKYTIYYTQNIPREYCKRFKDHEIRLKNILSKKDKNVEMHDIVSEYNKIVLHILCKYNKFCKMKEDNNKLGLTMKRFHKNLKLHFKQIIFLLLISYQYPDKYNRNISETFVFLQKIIKLLFNYSLNNYIYSNFLETFNNSFTSIIDIYFNKIFLALKSEYDSRDDIIAITDDFNQKLYFCNFLMDYLLFYYQAYYNKNFDNVL